MPITNLARFAQAERQGFYHQAFFHKTSSPIPTTGAWVDLSMGAGIPKYNAYVGGQAMATPLVGSGNDGVFLGANPSLGKNLYINTIMLQGVTASLAPAYVQVMDYLMAYPLIDGDSLDLQEMDNTLSLPRYVNDNGVQAMLVCTTPMAADAVVEVRYVNQAGVGNQLSTFRMVATANVGNIVSATNLSSVASRLSAFIPLANGDSGIRAIESVTLLGGAGGFFAIVLVKPLAHVQMLEFRVACEVQPITSRGGALPKIENGAYINMIALTNGTVSFAPFRGQIDLIIN